jgi:hypothetical protein
VRAQPRCALGGGVCARQSAEAAGVVARAVLLFMVMAVITVGVPTYLFASNVFDLGGACVRACLVASYTQRAPPHSHVHAWRRWRRIRMTLCMRGDGLDGGGCWSPRMMMRMRLWLCGGFLAACLAVLLLSLLLLLLLLLLLYVGAGGSLRPRIDCSCRAAASQNIVQIGAGGGASVCVLAWSYRRLEERRVRELAARAGGADVTVEAAAKAMFFANATFYAVFFLLAFWALPTATADPLLTYVGSIAGAAAVVGVYGAGYLL